MRIEALSFRTNPELVHRLLRVTTDFVLRAIDIAIGVGIDAFVMAGDFAFETGLLFSLDDYGEYLKPIHREVVDHVHYKGSMIAKHSDGNVWQLLDEWIEVGFDGFHKTVKETIEVAAPGGGYIISSSNSIHPNCEPENYIAMVEAVHEYGNVY